MIERKKRLLALILCAVLLLSLLPAVFAEEQTEALPPAAQEEEASLSPEPSAPEESEEDEIPPDPETPEPSPEEAEEDPAGPVPVSILIVCEPEDAVVAVYPAPEETEEAAEPAESIEPQEPAEPAEPIEPQEDGSYLLLPGNYLCSASAEGYRPLERFEFTVGEPETGTEPVLIELSLEPVPRREQPAGTVRVVFYRDPEDLDLRIYARVNAESENGLLPMFPEADGSWLLPPGLYLFSAYRDGFVDVNLAEFDVPDDALGTEELRIDIVLIPTAGVSAASAAIPPARPLPALTGNSALDVVNIADSQVGYAASSGGTVYGAWWTNVTNWGYDYSRADWCAMFVCWCANEAGAGLNVAYNLNGASTSMLLDWYAERGQANLNFSASPQPGDFLFFTNHVGLVTGYDAAAETVYFVAGNEGGISGAWSTTSRVNPGSVRWGRNVYRNGNRLLGYGRPNYSGVYYNPDPYGYTTAFAERCYSILLGRPGDPDGVAYWSGQLRAGMTTGASVVNGFVTSPEFAARGLSNEEIVEVLYLTMLDRAADEAGKAAWAAILDSGVSLSYLVNGFASSSEFAAICEAHSILPGALTLTENRDQNPNITAFVSRCYRLMLQREPDVPGLNDWCGHLLSGRRTGATLVDSFLTSLEFRERGLTAEEAVEILYLVMLDRPSDPAGKADWVSQVQAGATLRCVLSGFSSSQEFRRVCSVYGIKPGTLSNLEWRDRNGRVTQFVSRCYLCALERPGEAAGLNDWCERLLTKRMTPEQVAGLFVFSDECVRRGLSDESFIDMLYHLYMGREPDDAGRSDWLRNIADGMPRTEVAAAFASSAEFKLIVKSYRL